MDVLYDKDFYQWTLYNAELLRQGKITEIDIQNIAEELESMGKSQKRELISRLAVLIMHLLKWQYQPEKRSHSWIETINEQRRQIVLLLEDSPSLKHEIEEKITRAYNLAVADTEKETGIRKKILPQTCPYAFDELRNSNFWPEQ